MKSTKIEFKIDLQNEDYWTTLVSGAPSHCLSDVAVTDSTLHRINSIQVSLEGKIFASTNNQIHEISSDGNLIPVFGSCNKNCNMNPLTSASKLNNLVKFRFESNGSVIVIERNEDGSSELNRLQPIKPIKKSANYEVGFPQENVIRVYIADGRLVQIKDIYTLRTLKYFKYKGGILISVQDQFENEIKESVNDHLLFSKLRRERLPL